MAHAVAEFLGDIGDGHGAAEVGADVAVDALEDDVAHVVARMDVAPVRGQRRAVEQMQEQPRESVGDFQRVGQRRRAAAGIR